MVNATDGRRRDRSRPPSAGGLLMIVQRSAVHVRQVAGAVSSLCGKQPGTVSSSYTAGSQGRSAVYVWHWQAARGGQQFTEAGRVTLIPGWTQDVRFHVIKVPVT